MDEYNRKKLGDAAEKQAREFLEAKGYRLLQANYRCALGEIDLIMQDKEDIVFVEVRSKSRIDFGNALESVNKNKMQKIMRTATHYLQQKRCLYKVNSRFDIIAIHPIAGKMQLEWIKNAFWEEN